MSNTNPVVMSPVVPGTNMGLVDLRNHLLNTLAEAADMVELSADQYAEGMNAAFTFDWFYISREDFSKSDQGKLVRTEQKALYTGLKAKGHKNPSTFWDRLKAKGEKLRYPEKVAEREVQAAADAAAAAANGDKGEGGTPSRNRAPLVRNADEIAALVKFNDTLDLTAETRGEDIKKVQALLKQALAIIFHAA